MRRLDCEIGTRRRYSIKAIGFNHYSTRPNVDARPSTIDMLVGAGYGIPLQCSDQFIDPSLTDCADIISYINGVGPDGDGNLTLTAGLNINLVNGQDVGNFVDAIDTAASNDVLANPHTIFIALNFDIQDLCTPVPAK